MRHFEGATLAVNTTDAPSPEVFVLSARHRLAYSAVETDLMKLAFSKNILFLFG
jgi:hypothetical protein